jgi:hypothetical protein
MRIEELAIKRDECEKGEMKRKREVNYCFVWGFDFFLSVCLTTLLLFFYFSFSEISKSLHRETQRRKEMMNS